VRRVVPVPPQAQTPPPAIAWPAGASPCSARSRSPNMTPSPDSGSHPLTGLCSYYPGVTGLRQERTPRPTPRCGALDGRSPARDATAVLPGRTRGEIPTPGRISRFSRTVGAGPWVHGEEAFRLFSGVTIPCDPVAFRPGVVCLLPPGKSDPQRFRVSVRPGGGARAPDRLWGPP
jgi:hypothetical protein